MLPFGSTPVFALRASPGRQGRQHLRERLTLVLIALLPFHALLVTVGTKLVAGPGHVPLPWLAVWKEALLAVILVLVLVEIFSSREKVFRFTHDIFHVDAIDVLILALLFLGVIVTAFTHQDWKLAMLGFKYDFVPLVAFLIARRVPWSESFQRLVLKVLLSVGAVIAAYGILTAFLPMRFFLWLGYSPAHSLYFADGPIAAFQQVSETGLRRVQSTMSGPNQLGLWLLIPLGILLSRWARGRGILEYSNTRILEYSGIGLLILAALFLTFSRAAWIAAVVIGLITLGRMIPRRFLGRAIGGTLFSALVLGIVASFLFPSVFFRLSSSRGHLVRPIQAIQRMIAHPLGEGLGAAGPASNRVSETCVFLRPQDDPAWAKTTPALCVFLGTTQVQPVDHFCRCPFLPENWYLQVGVELGVPGFVLFIALIVVMLKRLALRLRSWQAISDQRSATSDRQPTLTTDYLLLTTFLIFLGVSIAALFLHAWEDSAVAYTVWLLSAVSLKRPRVS